MGEASASFPIPTEGQRAMIDAFAASLCRAAQEGGLGVVGVDVTSDGCSLMVSPRRSAPVPADGATPGGPRPGWGARGGVVYQTLRALLEGAPEDLYARLTIDADGSAQLLIAVDPPAAAATADAAGEGA